MANPFEVATVNPIQALLQGQAAYDSSNKRYAAEQKQQALQSATQKWQAGDKQGALQTLLGGGNFDAATAFGAVDQRDYSRGRDTTLDARHTEERAQDVGLRNQSLALQKQAVARAAEDKFIVKEVTDPSTGQTTLVRVKTTGSEGPINVGMPPPSAPNNPFAVGPKLNQDQSKAATMVDRMNDANGVISKNENINEGVLSKPMGIAQAIPFVRDSALFNAVASPERQQVVQAQRNFVNAILRVESGAAVSESEFNNAQRQYFPQVGDSKEVIEQKRQNRVTAMQGMAREAGPNYKPPAALVAQPRSGQQGAAPTPAVKMDPATAINAARDAIQRGADPNAVRQRLQQNGIDPSGL